VDLDRSFHLGNVDYRWVSNRGYCELHTRLNFIRQECLALWLRDGDLLNSSYNRVDDFKEEEVL